VVEIRVPVGVPEITQVVELMVAQAGRAGKVVQEVTVDPLPSSEVGVTDNADPTLPFVPPAPT
jgi:hypothetical protein